MRSAVPDDDPAVATSWAQYHPRAVLAEVDFLADLPSYTVAVEDGVVVGFCCGHHASGSWLECRAVPAPLADWDCSHIDTLVVDEARRGQGVGSALPAEFKSQATAGVMMSLMLFPKRRDGRPVQCEQLLRFYGRAGLQLLEPAEDYLRARPWMMGVPLTSRPRYVFARSTVVASAT